MSRCTLNSGCVSQRGHYGGCRYDAPKARVTPNSNACARSVMRFLIVWLCCLARSLTLGRLCSPVAWEPLGWQPAWFSEIGPWSSKFLASRFPLETK